MARPKKSQIKNNNDLSNQIESYSEPVSLWAIFGITSNEDESNVVDLGDKLTKKTKSGKMINRKKYYVSQKERKMLEELKLSTPHPYEKTAFISISSLAFIVVLFVFSVIFDLWSMIEYVSWSFNNMLASSQNIVSSFSSNNELEKINFESLQKKLNQKNVVISWDINSWGLASWNNSWIELSKSDKAIKVINEFVDHINNKRFDDVLLTFAAWTRNTEQITENFWNFNINNFVNALNWNVKVFNIIAGDLLANNKINLTYSLEYKLAKNDALYKEDREVVMIRRDNTYKIAEIQCVSKWCTRNPFFNPGRFGIWR